jgi:hypothetical protein
MEVKRQLEQVQVALEGATEDMNLMGRLLDLHVTGVLKCISRSSIFS